MDDPIVRDFDWAEGVAVHRYLVSDVFSDVPLEGNQLAVFVDGRPFTSGEMQAVAREMNLSETVYVLPPEDGGTARIRIFTPRGELPFAGHPVLGTAFVLASASNLNSVELETGAGIINVALERQGTRITVCRMRHAIPQPEPYSAAGELLAAVGVPSSRLEIVSYRNGPCHVFVALENEDQVVALEPDMGHLKSLAVPVSCFAGSGRSWKTRMFYPAGGVYEDAATGSAAGPLADHLARNGEIEFGEQIEIRQGAEIARPSRIHVRALGDSVEIAGSAVIVGRGEYRLRR
ncbi:PhzF family phenazine biosynthesis protein [Kribbella kalugense]|uniref:Trans-2,3-dihydro-3-hydroxyanthranilate isomerase n=1 Tax=Kribbella kalugense TaxID=2512221 RepID=A0A4R8A163_9ACTN|nr:PhzF family phenazine biosynthesis protein [Kribbella kalugense]TDW24247.1 trans-2,3-dihydro-3-hydroxyanthranilate isomerase [Kribbella kalugense]